MNGPVEFLRRPSIEAIVMRMTTQPPTPTGTSMLLSPLGPSAPPLPVVVTPTDVQGRKSKDI